jgi:hypothetical protein
VPILTKAPATHRDRPLREVVDISRDSLQLRRVEDAAPALHPGVGDALGDDAEDLVGPVGVLPPVVGEVRHRRAGQVRVPPRLL